MKDDTEIDWGDTTEEICGEIGKRCCWMGVGGASAARYAVMEERLKGSNETPKTSAKNAEEAEEVRKKRRRVTPPHQPKF